jgi:hypothetical protein
MYRLANCYAPCNADREVAPAFGIFPCHTFNATPKQAKEPIVDSLGNERKFGEKKNLILDLQSNGLLR